MHYLDVYNFLASWQLFPENGAYEFGSRPKSGFYKIAMDENGKLLTVNINLVTLEDLAFASQYEVVPDGDIHPYAGGDEVDAIQVKLVDSTHFETHFFHDNKTVISVFHEITPKGYLKVVQKHFREGGQELTDTELYHKQMSVLPYSASVAGAVIRPTEEGVIRHHALTAMEEQTNMQLTQIRQQVELLAIQAKEIQMRKEISLMIYNSKLSFAPVIGQVYYLYEQDDGTHQLSMIGPKEWGPSLPYKSFVSAVKLLADHTWKEV